MNTACSHCVHSRFRFSDEPVWNNLNDYGFRVGSHNPIIINEPLSCCLKKESPPLHVAHVNVCKPVNAPVSCCMHVNTSISNRANRAGTQPCPDARVPVCSP